MEPCPAFRSRFRTSRLWPCSIELPLTRRDAQPRSFAGCARLQTGVGGGLSCITKDIIMRKLPRKSPLQLS
jgi:hypothetical protein